MATELIHGLSSNERKKAYDGLDIHMDHRILFLSTANEFPRWVHVPGYNRPLRRHCQASQVIRLFDPEKFQLSRSRSFSPLLLPAQVLLDLEVHVFPALNRHYRLDLALNVGIGGSKGTRNGNSFWKVFSYDS